MKNLTAALFFLSILGTNLITESLTVLSADDLVHQYIGQESNKKPAEKDLENVDKKLMVSSNSDFFAEEWHYLFRVKNNISAFLFSEPHLVIQTPPPELG